MATAVGDDHLTEVVLGQRDGSVVKALVTLSSIPQNPHRGKRDSTPQSGRYMDKTEVP